jgi:hypothetical protein
MDLFVVRSIHGYRLRLGSVAGVPPQPWDTVVAVFPRCGHLADDVVNALAHDDHLVIQAPISCVLAAVFVALQSVEGATTTMSTLPAQTAARARPLRFQC